MKHFYLPLILFFLLVLEGVALDLLPTFVVNSHSLIVPHWVFIFLVFIALFYDNEMSYFSTLYGVVFGLLLDIIYTDVLGIYMFSYAIVIYLIYQLKKWVHINFYTTMAIGTIGLILTDLSLYIIYTFVGITDMIWKDYLFYRMLPTVLANIMFLILLYPLISKLLVRWRKE